MKVIKKNGCQSTLEEHKISTSIEKAFSSTRLKNKRKVAEELKDEVLKRLSLLKTDITTEKIKYAVRDTLMLNNYSKEANAFTSYTK